MRSGALAILVLLAAICPAAAQQQAAPQQLSPDMEAFKKYVSGQDYGRAVVEVAKSASRDIDPECKTIEPQGRTGLVIMQPPVFKEGATHPTTGLWRDQIKINRCGTPSLINLIFQAQETTGPQIGLLVPGVTGAAPKTQHEIFKAATPRVMEKVKCKDIKTVIITDSKASKVIKPLKGNAKGQVTEGQWIEDWSMRACGKPVVVPVEFTADGTGGVKFALKLK